MGWDGMTRASRRARQPPGDDQLPGEGGAGSGDASRDPRGTCVYKCVHAFVYVYQVLSDRFGSFVARLIRQSADRALRVTTIHVWASKFPSRTAASLRFGRGRCLPWPVQRLVPNGGSPSVSPGIDGIDLSSHRVIKIIFPPGFFWFLVGSPARFASIKT